ncbi:MAG TPA: DegT/DnrJ/EryC1/StrS family aminotransferase [Chlamydiales bacterium]
MDTMTQRVPFLDLRVSSKEKKSLLQAIEKVFDHGRFILGPEVTELEQTIAQRCGRKFAVGVGSGTDALFLAFKALGVGPGDEIITTSLSWIATTNAIAMTGATVVFADIGDDLNIDPASVKRLITSKTRAIVPVHYTGKICDMKALSALAKKHQLPIIEDAAQAFGSTHDGKPAGSFGTIACFSMNPMKIFAACGEAGIVLTDEEEIYQRLVPLRYNGTINKERCIATSMNCRLDTIQAAVLLERLKGVDAIIEKRRQLADVYRKKLSSFVRVPVEKANERDVYYTYQIQTPKRDELKQFLEERGIEIKIQHPFLMSEQPIYEKFARHPLPNAKRIIRQILCLPMHEKLSLQEQNHVIDSVESFFS